MRIRAAWCLALLVAGGCATSNYTLVTSGVNTMGRLQVTADDGWNLTPAMLTPASWPSSQTWTRDGLLLDRTIIIPGIDDGQALFNVRDENAALPVFHADMLPNEIVELTESSITKMFGEGSSAVSTENLRPQGFGENSGVMFDIAAKVTDSPAYRGMVGAFIDDRRLYMIMFLAAEPHYFEKHKAVADKLIRSATLVRPTIRAPGG